MATTKKTKASSKSNKSSPGNKLAGIRAFLADERFHKVLGLTFILVSLLLLLALISYVFTWTEDQSCACKFRSSGEECARNAIGTFGACISHHLIFNQLGIAAFLWVYIGMITGLKLLLEKATFRYGRNVFITICFMMLLSISLAYALQSFGFPWGGGSGAMIRDLLQERIGIVGTGLLVVFVWLAILVWRFNWNFKVPDFKAKTPKTAAADTSNATFTEAEDYREQQYVTDPGNKQEPEPEIVEPEPVAGGEEVDLSTDVSEDKQQGNSDGSLGIELEVEKPAEEPQTEETSEVELKVEKVAEEKLLDKEVTQDYDPTLELSDYKYPTLDLLEVYDTGDVNVEQEELQKNKDQIITTLSNYNIEISKIKATIGPTVTLYEIIPAPGVRISKIKNLEDDIALSLAALGIRIIAPMPGKGTVGIEVPNKKKETVSIRQVLSSEKFQYSKMELPLALGKTITNEIFIGDLATMPHLLMAGATGQGKSVGINTILASLLYKKHPTQLKFVLIDPKKVELSLFKHIENHFLAALPGEDEAIVTDTKKVISVLTSLCIEMDQRYDLLKNAHVRNIKEYNKKFTSRRLNPNKGHRYLPYIVLVIDEFADLIMTAGKEVEMPITRLAQLARAIGIHLVIATQRPTVNIITGTIKANFPARVAFKVTSKVDSKTILDVGGAEQLIGRGDMLLAIGSNNMRLQCAFVDTPEVEKITEFIGAQRGFPGPHELPEVADNSGGGGGGSDDFDRDDMFEEAARLVVVSQSGSTSMLQRRLKLGYNRAGRLMDQLEAAGIVGPSEGSKAREVLFKTEYELEQFLSNMEA